MFSSFMKIMPILTILGVGATAAEEEIAQQKAVKSNGKMQTLPCGIVEGNHCFARGCECTMGGAMEFDFLYWGASNTGFIYAYESQDAVNNGIGKLLRLSTHWDPGFRFGMGWNMDYDRWDLFANWTWFRDHATKSKSMSTTNGGYESVWVAQLSPSTRWGHVHGGWHMWHNAFDLELGRAFYLTKTLSLRPHYGFRGGWINQKFNTKLLLPNTGAVNELDFHGKNNYWGIGPRIGMHGKWCIDNSSWSILGKASGAVLVGETKTRIQTENITGSSTTVVNHYHDHFAQFVPNIQFFVGIDWSSCLDCNKYYLGVNAGWEVNYYWNQFNLVSNPTLPTFGNHAVTMQGLTLNLHFDF